MKIFGTLYQQFIGFVVFGVCQMAYPFTMRSPSLYR